MRHRCNRSPSRGARSWRSCDCRPSSPTRCWESGTRASRDLLPTGVPVWCSLLGVQLDDELLLHGRDDLVTVRQAEDLGGQGGVGGLEPGRHRRDELRAVAHDGLGARAGLEGENLARPHLVRRDVHTTAVDRPVPMTDELACLPARGREAKPHHDVVETGLEQAQQVLAGDSGLPAGLVVVGAELAFEDAVEAPRLLLLAKLEAVLGLLHASTAVIARRVGTALDAALVGQATLALEEQLHALTAALLALGARIAGHQTRLRLRGRQPLWAWGVTSRITVTSRPAA